MYEGSLSSLLCATASPTRDYRSNAICLISQMNCLIRCSAKGVAVGITRQKLPASSLVHLLESCGLARDMPTLNCLSASERRENVMIVGFDGQVPG